VAQATLAELRDLDAGSWFSQSFSGIGIPTLEEAIEVLLACDLGVNIELKPCAGREVETAECALDILSRSWDAHDKILISSFSYVCLETAHFCAADWSRGLLLPEDWTDKTFEEIEALCAHLDIATLHLPQDSLSSENIANILRLEKPLLAYTVNDPDRAALLRSFGVDGFFSDMPSELKESEDHIWPPAS
jgi:glycerophosphoryl diester phosphodiesterase